MPALTRTAMLLQIKTEARINDAVMDTLIGQFLDDAVEDCFFKNRCYELRITNTQLLFLAGIGATALPAAFQHIDQVRYSTDAGATYRKLFPKNDNVLDVKTGIPRFYEIQGTNLYVFPFSLVTTSHKVYLDYFSKPTFTSGSDSFPVLRLQSYVIQQVVARISRMLVKLEVEKASLAGGGASYVAGMDANKEQRLPDPVDTRNPNLQAIPADTE